MIENRYIPVGHEGSLDLRLAPDDCVPAGNIKGYTGAGTQFERSGDVETPPEVCMRRNDKVPVYLHVTFKIRPFRRKKRIAFLDDRWCFPGARW